MRKMLAIAACGFALTACTSSGDMLKTATPTVPVQFESEPAGAEVKTPDGQTCKTPCALAVPATDFTATFTLAGHQTQEIAVKLIPPVDDPRSPDFSGGGPRFDPHPVIAELAKETRRPARSSRPQPRPATAVQPSTAKPAAPAPAAAAPAPAAPAPAAPGGTSAAPWPTPSEMPGGKPAASSPWPSN